MFIFFSNIKLYCNHWILATTHKSWIISELKYIPNKNWILNLKHNLELLGHWFGFVCSYHTCESSSVIIFENCVAYNNDICQVKCHLKEIITFFHTHRLQIFIILQHSWMNQIKETSLQFNEPKLYSH